ncbi:hypothetical protein DYI37_10415 [Fulvimarina endophytica]|uniref:Uncharacterized protein n=1 Tax=Fulvimarina endophytica TaxID=2293836 RepID=A0A371X2J7_9HYPH|nr:hypothetical protein [Fulvimarina endophytica]RFC63442.1 hypothetical protein DYI37_10415 [Fulvimarina endophytica]
MRQASNENAPNGALPASPGDRLIVPTRHSRLRRLFELACAGAIWAGIAWLLPPQALADRTLFILALAFTAVFSVAYGKAFAALAVALFASLLIASAPPAPSTGLDYYDLVYGKLIDPLILAVCGLFLGEMRDRWRGQFEDAVRLGEFREHQRDVIAGHARELREHVDQLEFHLATTTGRGEPRTLAGFVETVRSGGPVAPALAELDFASLGLSEPLLYWSRDGQWVQAGPGASRALSSAVRARIEKTHGAVFIEQPAMSGGRPAHVIAAAIRHPETKALKGVLVFAEWAPALQPPSARRLAQVIGDEIGETFREAAEPAKATAADPSALRKALDIALASRARSGRAG